MNTKPITPQEALENGKREEIPPEVFAAVNSLTAKHFNGGESRIKLKDIKAEVAKLLPDVKPESCWWDFEPIYRQAGWEVWFDKPGYNERAYDAFYLFKPAKKL